MKPTYLLFVLLFCIPAAYAQQQVSLSSYSGQSEITASESITLLPGFHIPEGGSARIYISAAAASCVPLVSNPSTSQNYILTNTYRRAGITNPDNPGTLNTCDLSQTVTYYDGLGRPLQMVTTQGSPGLKDVVRPIAYDAFGRETKKYLSYTTTASGAYKTNALSAQQSFYNSPSTGVTGSPYPYAEIVFEPSPLNRVLEQGAPGNHWQPLSGSISGSGHTIKSDNGTNVASEVRMWAVSGNALSSPGYYAAGELHKTVLKDENWKSADGKAGTSEEFLDKQGRVVLKRVWESTTSKLSTYYVYDDPGNLRFVLPPGAGPDAGAPTQTILDNFCYQYRYDGRRRPIEKKLPGKGWENLVYNKLDQVVLTQDAVQQAKNPKEWTYAKYDAMGRIVMTGRYTTTATSQSAVQTAVNNYTILWESRHATNASGYFNTAFPSGNGAEVYTYNYYDDYTLPADCPYNAPATGQSKHVRGLQTATKTKILGGSYLWSVSYYDEKGRIIQTKGQNHLSGGNDVLNTAYNFSNQPTETTRTHIANGTTTIISERYEYDHEGRLVNTWSKVNSQAEVLLSSNSYNEIGELITKKLHSENGSAPLQTIQYRYNIRGWLTQSTAPLFAMQLKYEDGTAPQYNGNIANQLWGTAGNLNKTYTYAYDKLNRLLSGTGDNHNELLTYNVMGSITSLKRTAGSSSNVDQLTYSYIGNRLTGIADAISGNTQSPYQLPGTTAYENDSNGNLRSRSNSAHSGNNITIGYNYLNLPQSISGSKTVTYTYDAVGNKLKKVSSTGGTSDYIEGIHYLNGQIDFIQTSEGRILKSGSSWNYEYTLRDHLGNARVSFDRNNGTARKIQQDDYYPFGLPITRHQFGDKNKYLYNSKELQEELTFFDYGARFYDPVVGRWTSIDPVSELARRWAPYNYAWDNPMRFIDPDGMFATSPIYNITTGEFLGLDEKGWEGEVIFMREGHYRGLKGYFKDKPIDHKTALAVGKTSDELDEGSFEAWSIAVNHSIQELYKNKYGEYPDRLFNNSLSTYDTKTGFRYNIPPFTSGTRKLAATLYEGDNFMVQYNFSSKGLMTTTENLMSIFDHEYVGHGLKNLRGEGVNASYLEGLKAHKTLFQFQMQQAEFGKTTPAFQKYINDLYNEYIKNINTYSNGN